MKNQRNLFPAIMVILCGILAALVLLACSHYTAYAEALPSPDAAALIGLEGDLELLDAPADIKIAACLRVSVVNMQHDGAWADLILPYVPPGVWAVALFDGWHLIQGEWANVGDTILMIHFWPEDLAALDGTVGLYLVVLTE